MPSTSASSEQTSSTSSTIQKNRFQRIIESVPIVGEKFRNVGTCLQDLSWENCAPDGVKETVTDAKSFFQDPSLENGAALAEDVFPRGGKTVRDVNALIQKPSLGNVIPVAQDAADLVLKRNPIYLAKQYGEHAIESGCLRDGTFTMNECVLEPVIATIEDVPILRVFKGKNRGGRRQRPPHKTKQSSNGQLRFPFAEEHVSNFNTSTNLLLVKFISNKNFVSSSLKFY